MAENSDRKVQKLKQELIDRTIQEATKLRELATPEELEKLDFSSLAPNHTRRCIYGQMTGDCFSERAGYLIMNCCEKVYSSTNDCMDENIRLNGKLEGRNQEELESRNHFSAIETFIARRDLEKDPDNGYIYFVNSKNGNNKALIDFLKHKIDTLELKMW